MQLKPENENPILETFRYPQRIRGFRDVPLVTVELAGPYVGNQLDYELQCWNSKHAILVKGPTGCGKTTFLLDKLVDYALRRGEAVLFLVNRITLALAYVQRIAKKFGEDKLYTYEGLLKAENFRNVYITNYQGCKNFLERYKHIQFSYVIMDECHYFLTDAPFNSSTGAVLDLIPQYFKDSVRIYISATMDEIAPYILRSELYRFDCSTDFLIDKFTKVACGKLSHGKYNLYPMELPFPKVYTMPASYSRINLMFFDDVEKLMKTLNEGADKTIIFTDSIKRGKEVSAMLRDSKMITADILQNNPNISRDLIDKEAFDEKFLITTSVFSNGNNIKDTKVKNVVIFPTDRDNIVQMMGRRRFGQTKEADKVTLYIYVPTVPELENSIASLEALQREIHLCKNNEAYHLEMIKNGYHSFSEKIRNITEIDTIHKKYVINYLSEDKIYMDLHYLETMKKRIAEYGRESYCEKIARLFEQEYTSEQWFYDEMDKKDDLISYIKGFTFPMQQAAFEKFSQQVTEKRIRLFGKHSSDNTGKNRKPCGLKALNRRFEELNLPFQIQKNVDMFELKSRECVS